MNVDMGHLVGDGRNVNLCFHTVDRTRGCDDVVRTSIELPPFGIVVDAVVALDSGDQTHDLFLADLHPTADARPRTDGLLSSFDQVGPTQDEAARLRPNQSLAAGEDHQIEAFVHVLAQTLFRRHVGGAVVHRGDVVFLRHLDPLSSRDLTLRFADVEEEEHRGLLIDGFLEFLARLDLDRLGARRPDLCVEPEAMRLLDDHLVGHAGRIGQHAQLLVVAAGEAGGCPDGEPRGCAATDHCRRYADDFGDLLAGHDLQVNQGDEVLGGLDHRGHDLRRHDRTSERGDDAHAIDDVADAEAFVGHRGAGRAHRRLRRLAATGYAGRRCAHRRGLQEASSRSGSLHVALLGSPAFRIESSRGDAPVRRARRQARYQL